MGGANLKSTQKCKYIFIKIDFTKRINLINKVIAKLGK